MCGICGFIHKQKITEAALERMTSSISYRGPDDAGTYLQSVGNEWQLGLGHRRLAILDLTEAGHQPMRSADGKVIVCYNGEIYNYQKIREELLQSGYTFRSNCDTEVILYAYQKWGGQLRKQIQWNVCNCAV